MIYTNNINKFERNLRKQLKLTLNLSDSDFEIKLSKDCIYLTFIKTVLTTRELYIIEALLTDDYILLAKDTGDIEVWTTYEEEGE